MPYKHKEDKATQMRRYRQLQKQRQMTIQQYLKQVNRDFYNKMYGKSKPPPKKKGKK